LSTIAVVANYILFKLGSQSKTGTSERFKMNKEYLLATQELYQDPSKHKLSYSLARKEVLAISNLNAAFQRLTQDPKSKQKNFN
jgi:hypothetical protein